MIKKVDAPATFWFDAHWDGGPMGDYKCPLPFELEIGARWFVPVITKHSFGYTSTWIRISSYFQAW